MPNAGNQMRLQRRAVVDEGRLLARPVLLDEAQPLRRRVGERCAGPNRPGQRPAARLVEQVTKPGLGGPRGEPADRRAPALAPRRPDLLLNLVTIGQPVLRVPDRPVRTLDSVEVTSRRTHGAHPTTATPIPGHIGDTKRFRGNRPNRRNTRFTGPSKYRRWGSNPRPSD